MAIIYKPCKAGGSVDSACNSFMVMSDKLERFNKVTSTMLESSMPSTSSSVRARAVNGLRLMTADLESKSYRSGRHRF